MQQLRRWALDPSTVRSSSVYTALSRLEDEQLIEVRGPAAAKGTDRQPRMTYGATAAGEARLDRWLSTAPADYDELRLRIALARPADLDHLISYALSAEREYLDRLQRFDVPKLDDQSSPGMTAWEVRCEAILVSLDTVELASRARWLQDARVALESLRERGGRRSGS